MSAPIPWAEERLDYKGRFDELVCRDVSMVHVEMMADDRVWIGIYGAGGRVTVSFWSKHRLRTNVAHEPDDTPITRGSAA